ncbi:MAG: HicB like antitoxin of bacterial toxin-antitoxin system [Dehalococcoidia bacterium]|nr:HicB like antitoxin of bacterial toxin-antitoxin system [Dehalococcoidia bacterium]
MVSLSKYYQAEVHITKQEDGLWRLFVPDLKGCWVDCKTLEEGFSDIQEAIALVISYYDEHGLTLPATIREGDGQPAKASLPVLVEEYKFYPRTIASVKRKSR